MPRFHGDHGNEPKSVWEFRLDIITLGLSCGCRFYVLNRTLLVSREKPKTAKKSEQKIPDATDDVEPEKKRPKLDADESTMIQKVDECNLLGIISIFVQDSLGHNQ